METYSLSRIKKRDIKLPEINHLHGHTTRNPWGFELNELLAVQTLADGFCVGKIPEVISV